MSTRYFTANAKPTKKTYTIQITATGSGGSDTITITINNKTVVYQCTNNLIDDAAGLASAINSASGDIPELGLCTASSDGVDTVTIEAQTAGTPFPDISSAVGGVVTRVQTLTIAGTGPKYWADAYNWTGNTLPIAGDTAIISNLSSDILYDLDANDVALAVLNIDSSYTGSIGLPDQNSLGYREALATRLVTQAIIVNIGANSNGTGPRMVRANLTKGTAQTLNLYAGASSADGATSGVDVICTTAMVAKVEAGAIAFGFSPSSVCPVSSLTIGGSTTGVGAGSAPVVICGDSVALTTATINSGSLTINNGATTLTNNGGTVTLNNGAVTTLTNLTGAVVYNSSGTCGAYTGGSDSSVDFSQSSSTRTFTNTTLRYNSDFYDPNKSVTFTNPAAIQCKISELKRLDLGEVINLQRT